MRYLLDTNACIQLLRYPETSPVSDRVGRERSGHVVTCSVVKAELIYGAERSQKPEKHYNQLEILFSELGSLPFDDQSAVEYGVIRKQLESQGQMIGSNDLLIAAVALSNNLVLVTHNLSEFNRVPGLQVEDWQ